MSGTSRRDFILRTGTAAATLASLAAIRNAFGRELARLPATPRADEDFEALARKYTLDPGVGYLNHASIGTIAAPVQRARIAYLDLCETNPWLYMWGGAWEEQRERVRTRIAELLGCRPDEVAITHNTTELFNVLAHGLPFKKKDEVLFSSLCHAGASLPFVHRAERHGRYRTRRFDFPVEALPGITEERIVEAYREQIRPATRLLVIPHIDNTVGVRYPVASIVRMARERGVEWVAVDAAQTVGMIPVDVAALGVDFFGTSPHKWLGAPKGLGIAVIRKPHQAATAPMWTTWGQNRWSDSARKFEDYGTRNLPELLTLGDAIAFKQSIDPAARETRLRELWTFAREIVDGNPRLAWTSPDRWTLAGSLYSVRVERPAAEVAGRLFEEHGIVVRPFTTLGLNNLRISPNVFTAKRQIELCLKEAAA